jgi:acyl-CoA reductase-like NAD-dependent aldehyde dehydrogenase
MTATIPKHYRLWIDNAWHEPQSRAVLACASPLTGEILTTVPDADSTDVDAAVHAAQRAFPGWAALSARKRQELLDAVADRLVADVKRIAWLETANTGKPWRESHANVLTAADRLRYYAGACRVLDGRALPVTRDVLSLDQRTPLGVVGIVGAWNFPLNMFVGKIAPALAAGNTVVYKPAELTPITTLEIAALIGEVLPPGVVNVVTGGGDTAGAAMVAHPGIRKISLTGATATGRQVMRGAAATLKRLTLELGGKNAQIVFPDADLDRAAQGIVLGAFLNQGQVCTAGSRIFVHRDVAAALKDRLLDLVPRLRIGDPFDPRTHMGTLIGRAHFDQVLDYVAIGRDEGARLACGGGPARVDAFPKGLFLQPTLFDGVEPGMRIAREEIFGPIAAISEWHDADAMLAAVNGVEHGLAAGIWTQSLSRAHATARDVAAGRVWINCFNLFPSGAAFGGTKASGFGREDAFETLLEFTEVKNVIIDTAPDFRRFYEP